MHLTRRVLVFAAFALALVFGPHLFAQATEIVVPAMPTTPPQVPPATSNEWGGSIVWAFFASAGLEWLKKHPAVSLISQSTAFYIQRLVSIAVAAAAALGVHYTYDPAAGALTITGLTAAGLWTMTSETVRSWVTQEVMYRVAVKERT